MKTIRHRRKTETAAALITAAVLALLSLSAAGAGTYDGYGDESVYVSREQVELPSWDVSWPEGAVSWDISTEYPGDMPWIGEVIDAVSTVIYEPAGGAPDGGGTQQFTPDGNLGIIDDVTDDGSKQFITVETRSGKVFYIVIDRSRDTENVYFLNMVDDTDLFAITEGSQLLACTCSERCTAGHVNEECAVCRTRLEYCRGKASPDTGDTEAVPDTAAPDTGAPGGSSKDAGKAADGSKESAVNWAVIIVPLLLIGAGAAVYFLKFRKDPKERKRRETVNDTDTEPMGSGTEGA
jgi:hypothetical protein